MPNHNKNINACQAAAIAEFNRSVNELTAEISARIGAANDVESTKRSRRFTSAKAATLSEAADIARLQDAS